ncbi:hypothetical protein ACQ86N_46315 [Puia sp. P3]|uniref:hypothetical protein n=1 Tax=Puia sp. P3 TaxID=3423952 RepID=UPI003D67C1EA
MKSTIVNIRKALSFSLITLTLAGTSLVSRANNGNDEGKKGSAGSFGCGHCRRKMHCRE